MGLALISAVSADAAGNKNEVPPISSAAARPAVPYNRPNQSARRPYIGPDGVAQPPRPWPSPSFHRLK